MPAISASLASSRSTAISIDEPQPVGERRQAAVGVVGPQQQAILRPAGEHPVRLVGAAGDQIVDHHADVGLIAAQHQRLFVSDRQRRVRPGDESLGGGLFVAGGAVDLAGAKKARHPLGFQRRRQLQRRQIVVFDGVSVAEDFGLLQAGDQPQHGVLQFARQARRKAVDVDFVGVPPFRFEKQLVRRLVGEADDLGFDRRAVARPGRLDLPGVHRGAMQDSRGSAREARAWCG